jgi:hypothetical protein
MKKLAFATLIFFASSTSSFSADPPQKLAFLFAMPQSACPDEYECGNGQGAFETFLLVIDGGQMKVAVRTPHLYFPRKSGFWEVGILPPKISEGQKNGGTDSPAWDDWKLWASPMGQKPALAPAPEKTEKVETSEEGKETEQRGGVRYFTLSWVGSDSLSFTDYFESYAGDLSYVTAPMILSIDDVATLAYSQFSSIPAWTPPTSPEQYQRDLARCVSEDEEKPGYSRAALETATQGWRIIRGRMRWDFEWSLNHGTGAARGYNAICATSLRPPRSLIGADSLKIAWNQILPRIPDAQTAFSSPDGSVLLVFTKSQILAFRPAEGALSKPFATLNNDPYPILMAQWAIGKYADNWAQILSQAKSWTELSPTAGPINH